MSGAVESAPAHWPSQDARDRAVATATPLLPAPRFGRLPPLVSGQHRFVAASNGLFLQAASAALAVCLRVGESIALPYGRLQERVVLAGGPLPQSLFDTVVERSVRASPNEWAGLVLWDRARASYVLREPAQCHATPGSVRYSRAGIDSQAVVVDIHSHGVGDAYFSPIDDASDDHGVYLACVLGRCRRADTVSLATRIVVNGIHYPVRWSPWGEHPAPATGRGVV